MVKTNGLCAAFFGLGIALSVNMFMAPSVSQAQFGGLNLKDIGPNPLFGPARNGDWPSVDYLLKGGTDPNVRDSENGQTPLVMATIGRYFDIVESLLKFGARPDMADNFGRTALSWAAELGEYEIAVQLLDANASPNQQNREGLTPLMMAIKGSQPAVVQLLLDRKADLSIRDYTGRGPLDWARTQRNREIESILRRAGATG
ncbi:MAG TPA: hypothetical protein DCS82_12750 [Rhodospirillaceae bacterium]|nr:hypothetical protein [Rhodospirillaceae bacterium]HAA90869.1 hypothetical protein [Rhodospirillaceae bacterium]HAT36575.1 hypothetical protein [Rhodospirillaceae bacterium]